MLPAEARDRSTMARVKRAEVRLLSTIRQPARLSIGVAGVLGGAMLFTNNVASIIVVGGGVFPWVPLAANAALVFGGVMFFREYRRAARQGVGRSGTSPEADAGSP